MPRTSTRRRADDDTQREVLLQLIDEGYHRQSWHGPNLRGSLRGVTLHLAACRPADDRHSIWEIALHAAYWKYVARRRLLGEKRGSFPLKGSNWFPRSLELGETEWKRDLRLLEDCHRTLREAIVALPAKHLFAAPRNRMLPLAALIRGVAFHDVYHAGQIQLLKRLAGDARGNRQPDH